MCAMNNTCPRWRALRRGKRWHPSPPVAQSVDVTKVHQDASRWMLRPDLDTTRGRRGRAALHRTHRVRAAQQEPPRSLRLGVDRQSASLVAQPEDRVQPARVGRGDDDAPLHQGAHLKALEGDVLDLLVKEPDVVVVGSGPTAVVGRLRCWKSTRFAMPSRMFRQMLSRARSSDAGARPDGRRRHLQDKAPVEIDLQAVCFKEQSIVGVHAYTTDDVRRAIELIASGALRLDRFPTTVRRPPRRRRRLGQDALRTVPVRTGSDRSDRRLLDGCHAPASGNSLGFSPYAA